MNQRRLLTVTVQRLASGEFSWKLMKRHDSGTVECIAESSDSFPDFDQALDGGFAALETFSTGLSPRDA